METIYFERPLTCDKEELIVLRGVAPSLRVSPEDVCMAAMRILDTWPGVKIRVTRVSVKRMKDISFLELAKHYDPRCSMPSGLFREMQDRFPDFDSYESCTLVHFRKIND